MIADIIVSLCLRAKWFRTRAIKSLSCDIRRRLADERREKQEARRAKRREMRSSRKHCTDCVYFGGAICNSRNSHGWCRKFEEK